jgi:type IV secretory pathway TraG/TraD family ATPase VirD4
MSQGTGAMTEGEVLGFLAGGAACLVSAVLWIGTHVGARIAQSPAPPSNPIRLDLAVFTGKLVWPTASIVATVAVGAVALALAVLTALLVVRRGSREHVDRRAGRLTRAPEIARYTSKPPAHLHSTPGVPIGRVLPRGAQLLRATWEDQVVEIAGPRTGKTTSRAIPAVLAAPGPVVVTSNKRDIVDATRGLRERGGRPVWLFDPQRLASGEPEWWWDPLTCVSDVRTARKLAAIWATVGRPFEARTDAYFEPAGTELLAMMLLAARRGGRPISDVYGWLIKDQDDTPQQLLVAAGDFMASAALEMYQGLPEKQRAGVYGTAQRYVTFLSDPDVIAWVTDPVGNRPAFDATAFTQSNGTLYSISKEGEGSSAPLVTALTAAVLDAAEKRAATCSSGRLPVPLLGVLDEAANVCPWRNLPDLVSHYGSRSIVLMVILQSWSQGVSAWGEHGMKKLWGASNLRIYGGGVADDSFLRTLSALCGDHDRLMRSRSRGRLGPTVSLATHREPIFDIASLGAMPPGRALVILSGSRPVLVRSVPWMQGPQAAAIRASITRFDPTAVLTGA